MFLTVQTFREGLYRETVSGAKRLQEIPVETRVALAFNMRDTAVKIFVTRRSIWDLGFRISDFRFYPNRNSFLINQTRARACGPIHDFAVPLAA